MLQILVLAAATIPVALPSAVVKDLQCLTLAFEAADVEKDEKKLQGIITEAWYYLGRVDANAPGLNLAQALKDQAKAMQGDARLMEIGSACDSAFRERGTDLVTMGTSEASSGARP